MKLVSRNTDLGLLILRIAVGGVFLNHGLTKLTGMPGTISFFHDQGFSAFFAYLVACIETFGGLLMILGLWTSLFAGLFMIIMLVAIFKVKGGNLNKAELDLVMFLASVSIIFTGRGSYAIRGKKSNTPTM